jgi:hypothetical protein
LKVSQPGTWVFDLHDKSITKQNGIRLKDGIRLKAGVSLKAAPCPITPPARTLLIGKA